MATIKVSVIIPAYNEEKTIGRMLKSLSRQYYENFEVIIVDDGSTDGTFRVVQKFCEEDERFRYFKKENGGVSQARNYGLEQVSGDYVCFFDADDFVPRHGLINLVETAEETKADLIIGRMRITSLNETKIPKFTKHLSNQKVIDKLDYNFIFTFSLANKMYSRKIIEENQLRFLNYSNAEDGCFLYDFLNCCHSISGCKVWVYRYYKKPFWEGSSLSRTLSRESLKDAESAYDHIIEKTRSLLTKEKSGKVSQGEDFDEAGAERYWSRLHRRILNTCVKQYYRYIWDLSPEVYEETARYYNKYLPHLMPIDLSILYNQNQDILLEEKGIRTKEDFLAHPLITVVVTDLKKRKTDQLSIADLLEGIYRQDFPAFELLVDRSLEKSLREEQKKRDNLKWIDSAMIRKKTKENALAAAKGEYIIFLEGHMIPGMKSFKEMYNSINGADYITAPVVALKKDGEYEMDSVYEKMLEAKENDNFRYEDFREQDSGTASNKLFRVSSLRGVRGLFSGFAGKMDMRKVSSQLCCEACVNSAFITEKEQD